MLRDSLNGRRSRRLRPLRDYMERSKFCKDLRSDPYALLKSWLNFESNLDSLLAHWISFWHSLAH